MRYVSANDDRYLNGRSRGPVVATARRRFALPVPGRGLAGLSNGSLSRTTLRGFGATSFGPPVGAGAGAGAAIGASQGASIGSAIVPGIGTAIGAVVGAIGGAIAGAMGKQDPEVTNLTAAVNLYRANPQALAQIANKYLVLAGWFDLEPNQVNVGGSNHPVWMQYGRMGEVNFARDLANVVYQAAQSGVIGPTDTAASVYAKVVVPWISSFGKGQEIDTVNPGFIPTLIQGLILDYATGYWRNAWRAVGGDTPSQFLSIPMFTFPTATGATVQPVTASPTPSPQPVTSTLTVPITTVSTSPPGIGSAITAALDAVTGKMVAVPNGATYGGLTSTGAWIVVYATGPNAGQYTVQNSVLTPYGTSAVVPASITSIPAGYTLTTQTAVISGTAYPLYADANGNLYTWNGAQMMLYQSAATSTTPATSSITGGGGGGYYPTNTDSSVPAPVAPIATSGVDPNTLILLGGGALVLYLMMGRK